MRALTVTPAGKGNGEKTDALAEEVHRVAGTQSCIDRGYTGSNDAVSGQQRGLRLEEADKPWPSVQPAAELDYKSGREWRPTEDTAIAASILRSDGPAWSNWRRGQDYYQEGELFWLDADTKIRELTNDHKSLTDFLQVFLGKGGNTGPLIVTYNRDELVRDLNDVVQFDWASFIHDRIDLINPHANFDGITRGGYKIVYQDHPTESFENLMKAYSRRGGTGPNVWYSLGLQLGADGTIRDVRWGSLADKAKLAPGQKIIAVNGIVYKTNNEDHHSNTLVDAIEAAKTGKDSIHFLVQSEEYITPSASIITTACATQLWSGSTAPKTTSTRSPPRSQNRQPDLPRLQPGRYTIRASPARRGPDGRWSSRSAIER